MKEQWKIFCIALAMLCGEMTMPLMASDDSSVEGDDGAGGDDGGASDDGGAGDDGDAEEEEDADADNNSGAGDDGDAEEDDDAAANDDGGNEVGNNSDDVEEENPLEALGEKLGDDIISGGMDTVSALLDGDVDGATDALLQTGLDVEDDVLDTVGSEMSGKPVVSSSAASRRKTAACGAMADDEDEETQETVFGKATSSASSVGRQAFLRGLDMSEYGKALRDYGTEVVPFCKTVFA